MPETLLSEPNRQHLVRYLLDLLPEDEAERLDLASIADDHLASHLRLVESDLVDDYVVGGLTGATLERFEARYLSSARRRDHVKLAARFLSAVDRAAAEADAQAPPQRRERPFGSWWLLAAAALIMFAAGAFLFEGARQPAPALEVRRLPAQPIEAAIPKSEEPGGSPAPAPAANPTRPAPARHDFGVAALVLWPQTRSTGPLPTLVIAPGRAGVVLELTLESTGFAQYRAALKDPSDNRIVWRSGSLAPAPSGSRTSVRMAVPTTKLGPQHYSIELSARLPDGRFEIVDSYAFRVEPR